MPLVDCLNLGTSLDYRAENPWVVSDNNDNEYILSRTEPGNDDHLNGVHALQQRAWAPEFESDPELALPLDWIRTHFDLFPRLQLILRQISDDRIVGNCGFGRLTLPPGIGMDLAGLDWDKWYLGTDENGDRYLRADGPICEGLDIAVDPDFRGNRFNEDLAKGALRMLAEERMRIEAEGGSPIKHVTAQLRNPNFRGYMLKEKGLDTAILRDKDPLLLRAEHAKYVEKVLGDVCFDPVLSACAAIRRQLPGKVIKLRPNAPWDDPASGYYGSRYLFTDMVKAAEEILAKNA